MFKWFRPKNSIISFKCEEHDWNVIPKPFPSRKYLPDWFKSLSPLMEPGLDKGTIKRCAPFLDTMLVGWIIPLAADVHITSNSDCSKIDWNCNYSKSILDCHNHKQIGENKHPSYPKPPLKFINYWHIKVPKGWSVLFVPPLNRHDDRFTCVSGLVDCDEYDEFINFPAFWNKPNFNGILKAGTPLVQAIPIPRNSFEIQSNISYMNEQDVKNIEFTRAKMRVQPSHYRENIWVRK